MPDDGFEKLSIFSFVLNLEGIRYRKKVEISLLQRSIDRKTIRSQSTRSIDRVARKKDFSLISYL